MVTCPYAERRATSSIHCAALRERKSKWDFCLHQYFCRVTGKYEHKDEAKACNIRLSYETIKE